VVGVVATAFPAASEAGREMLAAGGNAVDAAVAAAWALCVCEPSGSGLGGQTVLLIHLSSGRTVFVDGQSYAPAAVSRRTVGRAEQRRGHRACTIFTTPATLAYAQERYGNLSLSQALEPAIRLAEDGFGITALQRRQLAWCRSSLAATPAARRFVFRDARSYRTGDLFRQRELAAALRRIAAEGAEDFYRGEIGRAIVDDMRRNGGLLDADDLAHLDAPVERTPLSASFRGYGVLTVPPPGGGGVLLSALALLEQLLTDGAAGGVERWYAALAEATHAAFAEREEVSSSGTDPLRAVAAAPAHDGQAKALAHLRTPAVLARGSDGEEPGETTHLCTADAQGNVVSLTQSIQSLFGAKVANDRYGFLYNNYLTTCRRRQGHPHRLRAHCFPRSNAAPTLLLARQDAGANGAGGGTPVLALGAAGSRRIISSLLHVLSGVVDRRLGLAEAIVLPRAHARLSGKVSLERPAATAEVCRALAERSFAVEMRPACSLRMGAVQAIEFRDDGVMLGAADPRRDGTAVGL
jgi:gamma-glutamyltranspeptidase/glutathione hydrolase